jgi:dihydropteroate synthase
MKRYYTRACNFFYGNESKILVKKKKSLPLNGIKEISFDHLEIISRKSKKKIHFKKINSLPKFLRKKINLDLKNIQSKKKKICKFKFSKDTKCNGSIKHYTR